MKVTRRNFIRTSGAAAGTAILLPSGVRKAIAAISNGTLDPIEIEKYVTQLEILPAMPGQLTESRDIYSIAVRQLQQQILPPDKPATTVWSYGSSDHPGTFHYPGFTIEAKYNRTTEVHWINELIDTNGNFLPHLLPVNPPKHWANPPGGVSGRDVRPGIASKTGLYSGPVPIVTHVHGAHATEDSNGFSEAWYLPEANNIPREFAIAGTYFDIFNSKYSHSWQPGKATFKYHNDQPAGTFWYHDDAFGMTGPNIYAGLTGFYLLRRGPADLPEGILPGPAPETGPNRFARYFEIPIVIQDRSFKNDGSLFYPGHRNQEFFGSTMVVNGRTWPFLEVERRRYRFRLLNGCNSRFLILKIVARPLAPRPVDPAVPLWQIGAEAGFLPAPVMVDRLVIGPAERADIIVDFTELRVGTELYLINEGPDEPFAGGTPGIDFDAAAPATTGQVMKLRVAEPTSADISMPPHRLGLPAVTALTATKTRQLTLNERGSRSQASGRPSMLGTLAEGPLAWKDPITENPALGTTELWEMHNFTNIAHPIHIHMVRFQLVGREPFAGGTSIAGRNTPLPCETGFMDTVVVYPHEITRIKAKFDVSGLFVWHSHIVEVEGNEMMRPYRVGP